MEPPARAIAGWQAPAEVSDTVYRKSVETEVTAALIVEGAERDIADAQSS